MAKKRLIEKEDAYAPTRKARHEPDWREWFLGTYAKYWYVLACLFVDLAVFYEVRRTGFGGWAVPFIALVLAVGLQAILYLRIWPRSEKEEEEPMEEEDFL
ncbi:MAG: hypothetical protein MUE65_04635 [Methanomassiliicoccales archaeon]|jgi:hypothetical protein|nr:hypothetical protein [Methanomassiliicoccales archaeon]